MIYLTTAKLIYTPVELSFIFCELKRITGRVPFYGTSYRDIVTKNMKGEVDFSRLKKENISKESYLKSDRLIEEDAKNRS